MLRYRALLGLLLITAWCSAAYHEELEAAGLVLAHEHLDHDHSADQHRTSASHGDHEPVVARELARDIPFYLGAIAGVWFVLAVAAAAAGPGRGRLVLDPRLRAGDETGPPLRRSWQFVERCALESAAPPVSA